MNIPMDKIVGLTHKQRNFVETIEENTKGLGFVSTGICPGCEQCRDKYGLEVECECEETQEKLPYCIKCGDTMYRKPTIKDFDEQWSSRQVDDEGHFSWYGCDLCGSPLGGTFYVWHAIDANNEIVHGERACVDCVRYLANGDLPE